jgi:acid phosphatase (class A)
MHRSVRFALVVALLASAASSPLAKNNAAGYLGSTEFDILAVLPPAPVAGDPRYESDRAIFKMTRAFVGTPRWAMAESDTKTSVGDLMTDFSCAAGVVLTPENAPHLATLMANAGTDTARETNIAKDHYKRLRPFQIDDGEICQRKIDLTTSYDYPSGHTTWGWTWATILAELIPDRATQILARGRAYGESRVVCGAHNETAVEAARLSASATLSVVRAMPAYKSDFQAAKSELDALRASSAAVKPQACDAEAALVAEDIFKPPAKP